MTIQKTDAAAKKLAQQLAANVYAKGYDYDRKLCKKFQQADGIPADGVYGPQTARAVAAYGVDAPKNLFVAAGTKKANLSEDDDEESGEGSSLLVLALILGGAYVIFRK